jgi:hypothetical protein
MVQPARDAGAQTARDDWPEQVAGTIVDTVDRVRNVTVGPIGLVARGVVYGLIIALLGSTALVLLVILLLRITDVVFATLFDGATMWMAYTLWGTTFTLLGLVLLGRARAASRHL